MTAGEERGQRQRDLTRWRLDEFGGPGRDRTDDLFRAIYPDKKIQQPTSPRGPSWVFVSRTQVKITSETRRPAAAIRSFPISEESKDTLARA